MILTYLILFIISSVFMLITNYLTQVIWSYIFVVTLIMLSYEINKIIFPNLSYLIGVPITFTIFSLLLCMIPYIGFMYLMTLLHIISFGFLSKCPIGCVRTSIGNCDCV
jgi:hypothetical protein